MLKQQGEHTRRQTEQVWETVFVCRHSSTATSNAQINTAEAGLAREHVQAEDTRQLEHNLLVV